MRTEQKIRAIERDDSLTGLSRKAVRGDRLFFELKHDTDRYVNLTFGVIYNHGRYRARTCDLQRVMLAR